MATSGSIRAAVEQLRADLDALRSHPHDVSGRWFSRSGTHVIADDGTDVGMLVVEAYNPELDPQLIEHIALTASPKVTEALIKWLTAIAEEADSLAEHDGSDPWVTIAGYAEARALAEAITHQNGT